MIFVIKRLLYMIPILFVVSTAVFFMSRAVPGNPVDIILGEQALPADRERLTREMNLDKPVVVQYYYFMSGLLKGDLGRSVFNQRPVGELILERYPKTLYLAITAMIIALGIALPAGILAALRKGTWVDSCAMLAALFGISMPVFWLGPLLIIILAVWLSLFPAGGSDLPGSVVLPALTLGLVLAAMTSRMTRSSMLDVLKSEYITTARAKGLPEGEVILKHAFRNALSPVVTIVGLQVGSLLAGAVVTEKIFSWPGVGSLLITAIERRDYPVVMGSVLVIALTYVIINMITDCMYKIVDPRVELG